MAIIMQINFTIGLNTFFRSLFMYNLDQFTYKQIKIQRTFM